MKFAFKILKETKFLQKLGQIALKKKVLSIKFAFSLYFPNGNCKNKYYIII